MKCPFCNYNYGYNRKTRKDEYPEEGDFYTLPIQMERGKYDRYKFERKDLCACPKCKHLFIDS